MTNDDVLVEHLRVLARQDSWRIPELPARITEGVLRVFDARGWVEFASWHRPALAPPYEDPVWGEPKRNESIEWFSPSRQPRIAGNLRWVLTKGQREPGLDAEVRVSEKGKAALAEWSIASANAPEVHWVPYDDEKLQSYTPVKSQLTKLCKKYPSLRRKATDEDRQRWNKPAMQFMYDLRVAYEISESAD